MAPAGCRVGAVCRSGDRHSQGGSVFYIDVKDGKDGDLMGFAATAEGGAPGVEWESEGHDGGRWMWVGLVELAGSLHGACRELARSLHGAC